MKTALVIVDGLRQIVLTPESPEEKAIAELLVSQQWALEIKRGQFFVCRGDYARFGTWPIETGQYGRDDSVMLVLRPEKFASTETP